MGVTFSSYDIARSGMVANERALNVIGHNISNVNTPGYVRQQAIIEDSSYTHIMGGRYQVGLGADIQEIRQIRYDFLDNMYRQENTTLGYLDAKAKTLEDIESILGEPMGEGLQSMMNQFWDSWQELAKDPNSLTARALVRQRAEVLVNHVNHAGNQLTKAQEDINTEIRVRIDEVNGILEDLAELNVEVLKAEMRGDKANDYRDKRNVLLDRLSELVDVDISESLDGQVSVMSGGYFLVSRSDVSPLYAAKEDNKSSFYRPVISKLGVEVPLKNGELLGLLESRDEIIPDIKDRLNKMIKAVFGEINDIHKSGKTLNGSDGQDFFIAIDGALPMEIGNIKLNNNLVDINNIVSSGDGSTGDNTVAYEISNLRNKGLIPNETGLANPDDYYQSFILYVGQMGYNIKSTAENQRTLVNAAEANRQSVTAVSLDEEMTNMIKFKYGYNASSRAINVVDEMIESIISRMGIVGR